MFEKKNTVPPPYIIMLLFFSEYCNIALHRRAWDKLAYSMSFKKNQNIEAKASTLAKS